MDPLEELKRLFGNVQSATEAGRTFYLIPDFKLPPGWSPERVDLLLCPTERDGYASRLFFSQRVNAPGGRNWNTQARLFERTWYAFSWRVSGNGLRPAQLVMAHLRGAQ